MGEERTLESFGEAGIDTNDAGLADGFVITVAHSRTAHIRTIGAGGGGGGCGDRTGYGGGGKRGAARQVEVLLRPGRYRIYRGIGGAGGKGGGHHQPNGSPGSRGEDAYVEFLDSGLRIASASGGSGGVHDVPHPEKGEDSLDENGNFIASGGRPGGWQEHGQPAQGPGAGGGGSGNQDGKHGVHGGAGGHGRVRIVVLRN